MAYVLKSIEIDKPVGDVYDEWTRYEQSALHTDAPKEVRDGSEAWLRWRAEVLTFAPCARGTRVSLRVDYDATGGSDGVGGALALASGELQKELDGFRTFLDADGEQNGTGWRWGGSLAHSRA